MPMSIAENSEGVVQVTVPVEGMTCASCSGGGLRRASRRVKSFGRCWDYKRKRIGG